MTPVQQIKQLALQNYNNGWDYIVECFTDEEIQTEYLDYCDGNLDKAIQLIQSIAEVRSERADEARLEIEANIDTQIDETPTASNAYSCPLICKNNAPLHGDWFTAPPLSWIISTDFDYDNYDDGIPF